MINPQIAKLKEERDRLRQQIDEYKREEETSSESKRGIFPSFGRITFCNFSLDCSSVLLILVLSRVLSHAHPYNVASATIFSLVYICAKVFVMVMALYGFLWGVLTVFDDEVERFGESARRWWAFHFGGAQPAPVPAVTPEEKLAETAIKNGKPVKNNGSKK